MVLYDLAHCKPFEAAGVLCEGPMPWRPWCCAASGGWGSLPNEFDAGFGTAGGRQVPRRRARSPIEGSEEGQGMATIREGNGGQPGRKARHLEGHVGGLSVYYHASFERQGLARHAHEQVQISIPIYRSRASGGIVCDRVDVIPGFEEHDMDWGGAREV